MISNALAAETGICRFWSERQTLLIETGKLPESYGPHPLRGQFQGCFDAHIKPDWVLVYSVDEAQKVVILNRTGTHQDLFDNY